MMTETQLILVPTGLPLSLIGASGVAIPSPVIDLLGQGVGTAPFNIFGATTLYGVDYGIGKQDMMLQITTGPAAFLPTTCTLNVQFQLAVDQGAGGNYQPGTWNTIVETGTITPSSTLLIANQVIARFDWPPAFPAGLRPRYMRINFLPSTSFTTASIGFAGLVPMRDDQANRFIPKNYAVA